MAPCLNFMAINEVLIGFNAEYQIKVELYTAGQDDIGNGGPEKVQTYICCRLATNLASDGPDDVQGKLQLTSSIFK